jgi:D-alanine-D-alanine ligase
MDWKNIIILFGGSSEEKLVSVASAQNLLTQIPEAQLIFIDQAGALYDIAPSLLARHLDPFTQPFIPQSNSFAGHISKAIEFFKDKTLILALHGTEGEDGTLQELFEKHHIAFTGTGSTASRLAFDKKKTKEVAEKNHLRIIEDLIIQAPISSDKTQELESFLKIHNKIVIKPVASGSSVGLFMIENLKALESALSQIQASKESYIVEPFIVGREITVCVRENPQHQISVLPCSEIKVVTGRQFDYQGKYLGLGVQELTPAPIGPEESKACQDMAIKLHQSLNCTGYTRTDMILTERGPILLEINTLPGLSKASFVPQQLIAAGESLRDFFAQQIQLARARYKN